MPKEFFLSDKSQKLSYFKSIVDSAEMRNQEQRCVIFGKKTIMEAIKIESVIVTEESKSDVEIEAFDKYIISNKAFKKLSHLVTPEPYAAICRIDPCSFPKTIHKGLLVLDSINDPGNMGTIFRTAYGMGLDGLIILKPSCDPYHEKVLRASKACSLKMPWVYTERETLETFLNSLNTSIFVADLDGQSIRKIQNTKPFALILGNESQGVSPSLKTLGTRVHIPQNHLESYNVAIAQAILTYALLP